MEHREKYIKKGRGKKFNLAVSECDQHIKAPMVFTLQFLLTVDFAGLFKSFVFVSQSFEADSQNQIMVAREFDFVVKNEPEGDDEWYNNEVVNTCSGCSDKQALIDQIKEDLKLKTQKVFDLQTAIKRMEDVHNIEIQELNMKLEQSSHGTANNEVYEVERLLDHKQVGSQQQFFVKWKGFDESHNTWVKKKTYFVNLCFQNI